MHLFLSPHYDDAVYSCGGTIHQLCAANAQVTIATLMGGAPPNPPPDSPIVRTLHARWEAGADPVGTRRQEDATAATQLGASVKHHNIPDCIYRTDPHTHAALYPTERHLWNNIHPQDPALKHLSGIRLHPDATHIYIPLGVGGHVDHLIVREYGLSILTLSRGILHTAQEQGRTLPAVQFFFYADFPYIEQEGALARTIAQLPPDLYLTECPIYLTEADIVAKINAVSAYRSQISTFWQDEQMLGERVRAALQMAPNSPPAELFYSIPSS